MSRPVHPSHPALRGGDRPDGPGPSAARWRRVAASIAVSPALVGLVGCGSDDEATPTSPTLELTEADPGASDGSTTTRSDDDAPTTTTPGEDGPIDLGPLPELTELERSFADAVVDSFEADEDGGFFPDADVECMAVRWVAVIGEDALSASGMTPAEFGDDGPAEIGIDRSAAEQMVRIMEGCGGNLELFYEAFVEGFVGTEGEDLGEAQRELLECMREVVPVADVREALTTSFMGDDAGLDAIGDRWLECAPSGR